MKDQEPDTFHHLQAVSTEANLLDNFFDSRGYIKESQKVDVMLMYIASMMYDDSIDSKDLEKFPKQIAYYYNVLVDAHEEVEDNDEEEDEKEDEKEDEIKELKNQIASLLTLIAKLIKE